MGGCRPSPRGGGGRAGVAVAATREARIMARRCLRLASLGKVPFPLPLGLGGVKQLRAVAFLDGTEQLVRLQRCGQPAHLLLQLD
eukprot:5775194-Pyramimonas_sp.AAC.2